MSEFAPRLLASCKVRVADKVEQVTALGGLRLLQGLEKHLDSILQGPEDSDASGEPTGVHEKTAGMWPLDRPEVGTRENWLAWQIASVVRDWLTEDVSHQGDLVEALNLAGDAAWQNKEFGRRFTDLASRIYHARINADEALAYSAEAEKRYNAAADKVLENAKAGILTLEINDTDLRVIAGHALAVLSSWLTIDRGRVGLLIETLDKVNWRGQPKPEAIRTLARQLREAVTRAKRQTNP